MTDETLRLVLSAREPLNVNVFNRRAFETPEEVGSFSSAPSSAKAIVNPRCWIRDYAQALMKQTIIVAQEECI